MGNDNRRRSALEIVEDIAQLLERSNGIAMPKTNIAKKLNLNYNSCKEYLEVIKFAQRIQTIEEVRTARGGLILMKDLSEYPEAERKRILKEDFGVRFSDLDDLYISMLASGVTVPKKALKIEKTKPVKDALKRGHLKETKGRIYLTELGQMIAKGAKKLFE